MKYAEFSTLLNNYLYQLDRSQSWLAGRLSMSPSTIGHWCAGQTRPGKPETIIRIADVLNVHGEERQVLLAAAGYGYSGNQAERAEEASQKTSSTPSKPSPPSHTTNVNTGGGFYSAGDTNITGNVITKIGTKNEFSGSTYGPIHTGRGDINFGKQQTEPESSLQEQIETLRHNVSTQAPSKRQSLALMHINMLNETVMARELEVQIMKSMHEWFQKYIPVMIGRVVQIISHPTVVEMAEAAGEPTRSEFQRLLRDV